MWQPGWFIEDFVLSKRAIVDVRDRDRRTPLVYASIYNNTSAISAFIDLGAIINVKDSLGNTPLHHALRESHDSAALLIGLGATIWDFDGFDRTSLQLAIRSQNLDAVKLILAYLNMSVEPSGRRLSSERIQHFAKKRDCTGKTALHNLCEWHDPDKEDAHAIQSTLMFLVQCGTDINIQDNFGCTPAHKAAISNNEPAMCELLALRPNMMLLDQHRCTALDWALAQGQISMVQMLRSAGGKETKDYTKRLGAYQRSRTEIDEKKYDMNLWALTVGALWTS